ncbi:APC family permease [Lewinella sp. IMCC34183]|uniref:APC family permease n=1 Tax=Lewinella sp. IMCC34183 TaxID=2248762 RepID=UPI000E22004D|nr:APC family permease [Lewinella sp. IMCC34183]
MSDAGSKLSPISVWALAAGGMVGGGIYTVLGVVIAVSAQWAWLAFAFTGVIALCSAYSYVFLCNTYDEGGGAFDFLEEVDDDWLGGSLGWMLILGYVLTISVYAYAFGHYVAFAFHGGGLVIRGLAAGIVAALIGLNLAGAGKLTKVEVGIVSVNLLILLGLGVYGLTQWDTTQLTAGVEPRPAWSGFIGGAAIFMAYEGFQLLSYEYDRIKDPHKNFMPTLMSAVVFVVLLYIVVALGATFVGSAATLIDFKEIALSITAREAFGETGLIIMTLAAGFATAAAINSTLFSTANLTKKIAKKGELPGWFDHTNGNDVPDRSIILLGSLAGILAVTGSLSALVEAASLVFLATFGIVNWLCYQRADHRRWIPATGIGFAALTAVALLLRVAISKPVAFGGLILIVLLVVLGRPLLLRKTKTDGDDDQ